MSFDKQTFQNKSRKRLLEDRLTDIKIAYASKYGVSGGYAISLTGPAVEEHLRNYARAGVDEVIIAEKDFDTYVNIDKDLRDLKKAGTPYVKTTLYYKDVADVVRIAFMNKLKPIVDIDLDFTATPSTTMPTILQIWDYMEKGIGLNALGDYFTFTVTFCQRPAGRKAVLKALDKIMGEFNHSLNFNVRRAYYQSYADGAPMATAIFLLYKVKDNLKPLSYNGKYQNIEPLLIKKGIRKF